MSGEDGRSFVASEDEKRAEETRVHAKTRQILQESPPAGIREVLAFFARWHDPFDGMLEV